MKKNLFIALIASALFSATAIIAQEAAVENNVPTAPTVAKTPADYLANIPEVVATANGETVVTREEIVEILTPQLEFALNPENKDQIGIDVTQEIIDAYIYKVATELAQKKTIENIVAKSNFKFDEKAINKEVDDQITELKQRCGSEENFKNLLLQYDKTEEGIRQDLAKAIKLKQYLSTLIVQPTDQEIADAYEEFKPSMTTMSASHILVAFGKAGSEVTTEEKAAAMNKILDIKTRLDAGEDFAKVAKECSDCPSKAKGGDLGQFKPGQMVPEFENAVMNMKEGEIAGPVETQFGYHMIKCGPKETRPLSEVKEEIRDVLVMERMEEAIEKLLKDADLKIMVPAPTMLNTPGMMN